MSSKKKKILAILLFVGSTLAWIINYAGANFTIENTEDFKPGVVAWPLYIAGMIFATWLFRRAAKEVQK